jgi:hypothetical protein
MGDEEVADLCVGGDLVVALGEAMTLVCKDEVVNVDVATAEFVDDLVGFGFGDARVASHLDDHQRGGELVGNYPTFVSTGRAFQSIVTPRF